jgi:hypothetical protein
MATDKYLAICESGGRTVKMWAVLYPRLAMLLGDDPDLKRLVIAMTDLRMDLPLPASPTWHTEPCLEAPDE